MGLSEKNLIINQLSPPLEKVLVTQLVDEFISMERRFIQRDWEPTELDGGQFCEALARIIYHIDSGNLNVTKSVDDCLRYIDNDGVNHNINPRTDTQHIARVIRTVYKFRSQRGAVHISSTYSPNHMDSKYVIEAVRWCMNETLRIFWNGDREKVAAVVRELLQFDVPCIGSFASTLLVQRTDLESDEEVLLLLHYAGDQGFTRLQLGQYCLCSASSVTRALQKLSSPQLRQVVLLSDGAYRLTDLGSKRIREQLASKLVVQ